MDDSWHTHKQVSIIQVKVSRSQCGWLVYMCVMTHSYVCHDLFICVTWLIHICDTTFSISLLYITFIYVTWLVMSHVNESCHIWTSHVTYERVMSHMNESCHMWMSHVTYERVMSHMNESCHIYAVHNVRGINSAHAHAKMMPQKKWCQCHKLNYRRDATNSIIMKMTHSYWPRHRRRVTWCAHRDVTNSIITEMSRTLLS